MTYAVRGRIDGPGRDLSALCVELRDSAGHVVTNRVPVAVDGGFSFDATSGNYDVRVVSALNDDLVAQEFVAVSPMTAPIVVHLPPLQKQQPVSGVVSVKELQQRVPKKAWQAFVKAQQYSEASNPQQAIVQLERAIALVPGFRDAHANLGVQFLRTGRTAESLAQFREALRIGPPTAMLYTDLAAALATARRFAEGESAARLAIHEDPSDLRARYLLGNILAGQPGREKEALENLSAAFARVPAARVVASQVMLRTGDRAGAVSQLHEYLNSGDQAHCSQVEQVLRQMGR